MRYQDHFTPAATPQTLQADSRQVQNSAGGYTFQLEPMKQLERWLILGSEGGTYYATERKLTIENARVVQACLDLDPRATVDLIGQVSTSGRAPKNDPAIFALALAMAHPVAREAAGCRIAQVCRTGTHLFQFVEAVSAMRGWGRGLKGAVAHWYTSRTPEALAYQVAKYPQRDGMSHKRLLRRAHPVSREHNPIFRYVVGGQEACAREIANRRDAGPLPCHEYLVAFDELQHAGKRRSIELIETHGFTHEMVRKDLLGNPDIWAALLPKMPITALIRSLARMTANGLLRPMSTAAAFVCQRLTDPEVLRKGRVHPVQMIQALLTYKSGQGVKGSLTWSPVGQIVDALDAGFYESFHTITPSGKRFLLAIDTSGSMLWPQNNVGPNFPSLVAAAVMAMITARTEKQWMVMGFSGGGVWGGGIGLAELPISPRQRLDDVVRTMQGHGGGATDCSLPMRRALDNKLEVDAFAVYTDNETWIGPVHPQQALRRYRAAMGIDARLAVVAMTPTPFTIADPSDPGMLDVVGFDASAAALISDFAAGG